MGTPTLSTILCCSLEKGIVKKSDITWITKIVITHYNTEDLNLTIGVVAQKVEQRIETPCADGSIPFPYH